MVEIINKPVKIEEPHIDAIHGHTILELKNVKNGSRERIESDNIVTDGINSFLNQRGIFRNNLQTNMRNVFGGLLMFDTAIPTSPMARFKPAGVKMIGNGRIDLSNSGVVSELGSYNSIESSRSKTGITHVWDFSTSQANGSIASVCLCHYAGGRMGYGNTQSMQRLGSADAMQIGSCDKPYSHAGTPDDSLLCVRNNFYYTADNLASDSTQIKIYKRNCPISELTLPLMYSMNSDEYETITISCTAPGVTMRRFFGEKTLFFVPNTVDAGATVPFYSVDLDTLALTEGVFTNTTERPVFTYNTSIANGTFVFGITMEYDTKIVMWNNNNNLLCLTLATGEIEDLGYRASSSNRGCISRFTPSTIFIPSSWGSYGEMYNANYLLDINLKIMAPCQVTSQGNFIDNTLYLPHYYHDFDGLLYINAQGGDNKHCTAMPNPLRLNTINNLNNVVIKTAAQTMKVTYQLSME